jgi:hypothetical protein
LDPLDDTDAGGDLDSDGLSNMAEYQQETDPNVADSDDDGLSDGDEVNVYSSDPLNIDSDGDELDDGYEVNTSSTDPADPDSDDEGLNDGVEVNLYQTDPNDADTDGDGVNDFDEVSNNSNPLNAADNGVPNTYVQVQISVGDDSLSHSEKWGLYIRPEERITLADPSNAVASAVNAESGQYSRTVAFLEKGQTYYYDMMHLGSDPSRLLFPPQPDYDYFAHMNGKTTSGVYAGLNSNGGFVIDDYDDLLGFVIVDEVTETNNPTLKNNGTVPKTGKVTILKVEFDEDPTQSYGFDDYTDSNMPWKSVENGKTDKAKAKTTPFASASQIYFKSVDTAKVTVSPAQASTSPEPLKLTGVAKGESEIQGNAGSASGSTVGKMKVACYDKKTKTIAVTLVHEAASGASDTGYTSTDISDANITAMLQKVYGQSVQEFTLIRRPAKTVDFDDNHDGMVDVESWMSGEMTKIRDACQSSHDFNIFFVDKPTDGSLGFMQFNQKYGFVHADNGDANTVAHELGHGQGLPHTATDADNIMHPTLPAPWRLRKSQWDSLNP